MDPRRSELAGVVPKSLRPLLWLELVGLKVPAPPGEASLHPAQRDRLQALSLKRLRAQSLDDAERQFLRRMLVRIDSGDEVEVEVPRREHFAAASWSPTAGESVALSATGSMQGRPVVVPSLAGYPVVGEVVRSDSHSIVFKL
ncbi:MAG: hypothetical protein HW413_2225 [Thermoleophilia bacterium]|nr:hypothetical protein [Thermoleophilia bacterium]